MKYICKIKGEVNSEQCFKCFKTTNTGHSSRPQCVEDNAEKVVDEEEPLKQVA